MRLTVTFKGGSRNPYTLGPEVCGGQHLHISIGNHPIDLTLSLGSDPGISMDIIVTKTSKSLRFYPDFAEFG